MGENKSIFCWVLLICLVANCVSAQRNSYQEHVEDNEFAEFEEFDEDDDELSVQTKKVHVDTVDKSTKENGAKVNVEQEADDEGVVEDDDEEEELENEFDHFQDNEEFEGFEGGKSSKSKAETADIKITKVPTHLRTNWDGFYMEWLMIFGLVVYFINFIAGRNKNQKLANAWLNSHRQLLEQNFQLVGDDGKANANESEFPGFLKESENVYTLWCSGRTCCEGMLVELSFIKRQDLIHIISQLFKKASDQIIIKVNMNADDMDTFIFTIMKKKTAMKMAKNLADISALCPERKNPDKYGIPQSFVMYNELGEVPSSLLDSKITTILNKYEDFVDYIHISDQYSGQKLVDDQPVKSTDVKKVLIFAFNVPGRGHSTVEGMEEMKPMLQMVFYMMDKVKRFRLTREAKQKADKSRVKLEEAYLKTTHQQRVEAAQQRKEDKRRAEKERIMNEDDPEKQRKWEEREHRRELKKKAPKMKQLKVKRFASSEPVEDRGRLIYQGKMVKTIMNTKYLSWFSTIVGISLQPTLISHAAQANAAVIIIVGTFVGFFTYVTPFLIHMLTKRYVTKLFYVPASQESPAVYTCETISFFLRPKYMSFGVKDVVIPEIPPPLTSFTVRGHPFLVDIKDFTDFEALKHMLGYDKPIDLMLKQKPPQRTPDE